MCGWGLVLAGFRSCLLGSMAAEFAGLDAILGRFCAAPALPRGRMELGVSILVRRGAQPRLLPYRGDFGTLVCCRRLVRSNRK